VSMYMAYRVREYPNLVKHKLTSYMGTYMDPELTEMRIPSRFQLKTAKEDPSERG
jgi:hypothetical protein